MSDMIDSTHPPIEHATQMWMDHFNMQPSSVKGRCNAGVIYYKRILYNKAFSVFKFHLPKNWALNWVRFWLFEFGSFAAVYTNKWGWIAQPYSIVKLDYQYNPKQILVYNSHIATPIYGVVGVNCEIIHLFGDYFGIDDIVTRYAEMLAQTEKNININLMNANVAAFFEAKSKKQANDIKAAYSDATEGKPLVVLNAEVADGKTLTTLLPKVRENFIVPDLIEARRAIINAFLTEIGIRNVSVQKKERLTQGEYSENNDETKALASIMLENMQRGFNSLNRISGLSTGVDFAYEYTHEDKNVSRETSRNVSRET